MAFQTITGGLWLPLPTVHTVGAPSYIPGSLLIDASAEKAAFIFRAPKTGTLDKAEIRTGAVTLGGSSVLRLSFQDVDLTTGFSDGTQDQYRDIAAASVSANSWLAPGLMTSDGTDGGTKRSVTVGDQLSVVLEYSTFTASDSVIWAILGAAGVGQTISAFPTAALYTASWAFYSGGFPVMALKYSDGTYAGVGDFVCVASAVNSVTYNSGSTPDERALYFQLPAPVKVGGAWVRCDLDGDADVVLYDSDGSSVLSSASCDKDVRSQTSGGNLFVRFAEATLAASTTYRLSIKPTSATSLTLYDFDVSAAAILGAVAGGSNWHFSSRTDAGAWSQVTTKRIWAGLLVTAIDDGVGGGGGLLTHPGMSGGMRG